MMDYYNITYQKPDDPFVSVEDRRSSPIASGNVRMLGMIQYRILQIIRTDPDQAYGAAIQKSISSQLGRDIPNGQVHLALKRLEDHGLITESTTNLALSKRTRGRPRKYFALTSNGQGALNNAGTYEIGSQPIMKQIKERLLDGNNQKGEIPDPVAG